MTAGGEPWRKLWKSKESAVLYLLNLRGTEDDRRKIAQSLNLLPELEQAQGQREAQQPQQAPSKRPRVPIPSALPADVLTAFTEAPEGVIVLRLPWPPSVNHYYEGALIRWPQAPAGRPPFRAVNIVGKEGKAYAREVAQIVSTLKAHGVTAAPPGARLKVEVTLHAPTRAALDLDNRMKGLLDALTDAQVWADDSLIDDLHIRRGEVIKGGAAVVAVRPLSQTLF